MTHVHHRPILTSQLTPQNTNNSMASRTPGNIRVDTSGQFVNNDNVSYLDSVPDDAPPPYSLLVNASQGEIPIQLGPSRPFQDSPSQPQISHITPQPAIRVPDVLSEASIAPPLPARRSAVIPTSADSFSFLNSPTSPRFERQSTLYTPSTDSHQLSPVQDRGRVYDPPPSAPPPRPVQDRGGAYDSPTSAPPSRFVQDRGHAYDPPIGAPPRPPVPASSRQIDTRPIEDGRPTTTPVPGHPLLLKNKLLVYPLGYECSQCKNVGYRNNDPSHPCAKCWNKYSRPYCGALAYAPFPSESNGTGMRGTRSGGSNFQRPLPKLQAPQTRIYDASFSSSHSQSPIPTEGPPERARLLRRRSELKPNIPRNDHVRAVSSPGPISPRINTNLAPIQTRPFGSPVSPRRPQSSFNPLSAIHQRGPFISTSPNQPPPRGSVVFQAGDPRIGGRLCWRCDGKGNVSYFLIDTSTCEVCNGIGRTFP